MSKGGSQKFIGRNRAPRVQIEYDTELYGAQKKVQLPFVMAVMADLKGKAQEGEKLTPVASREFEEVQAGTLEAYIGGMKPRAVFDVPDKLSDDKDARMKVDLTFASIEDFSPARVAENTPALKELMDARRQLKALLAMIDGRMNAEELIERLLQDPALMASLRDSSASKPAPNHQTDTIQGE